jgi:hypothetical protein
MVNQSKRRGAALFAAGADRVYAVRDLHRALSAPANEWEADPRQFQRKIKLSDVSSRYNLIPRCVTDALGFEHLMLKQNR